MGYEWLSEGLLGLRGIEPHEVLQALAASRRLPMRAATHGVVVLSIWARTHAGRPLIVIVRQSAAFDWVIVGALEMDAEQLVRFEKWEGTR